jgi:GWxTD domain-containing protein
VALNSDTTAFGRLRGDSEAQADFLRQFWRSKDPDLTSAANEVQLEYLSRGAYAYFLYFDQRKQRWDERGAILVRYGMPDGTAYNPPSLGYRSMTTNRLVWTYLSLGMIIDLEDRFLNEVYDLPISLHYDMDPRPVPEMLMAGVEYGDITLAGKGVFRARRPGTVRLAGVVQPAMFRRTRQFDPFTGVSRSQQVGRVELYLGLDEVGADDEIEAEAVVFDEDWRELGRMKTDQVSWCTADWGRIYQFNFELPEGNYTIGVTARNDSIRAEASWKIPITVTAPLAGHLEISDIELACEFVPDTLGSPFDKTLYAILPSPRYQVERDRPLGIYFEIYGLVPDETGYSLVSVEYTIESVEQDRRPFFLKLFNPQSGEPLVQVSRTDETPGRVRFQYVSTELDNPEPGPYRLDIKVTDERSGQIAIKSIDFSVTP